MSLIGLSISLKMNISLTFNYKHMLGLAESTKFATHCEEIQERTITCFIAKAVEHAKMRLIKDYHVIGVLEQFEDTLELFEAMMPKYYTTNSKFILF